MKQNNLVIPIISYSNTEQDKYTIYKDNKNKSGIYRWNNLITGKSYIGSSICLGKRFTYFYCNKNIRPGIYNAILKYGHSNFSLDILEYCKELVIKREQYYIDLLKPEYNICKYAGSCLGYRHTEEIKELLSNTSKGCKQGIEFSLNSSKTRRGIKYKSYIKSSEIINREVKVETKLKLSSRVQGINVKIFDRSNNLINEFSSITSAAKYMGVHRKTISRIFETGISYDDFIYKFENKENRIWVYSLDNKLTNVFKNMKETGIYYNISLTTLSRYIKLGKIYKNKYSFYNVNSIKI